MKNKHLIIIIVILFVISIISSPRKTTSFNNVKKPIKEEIVFKGEIANMDKNENPTALSEEYSNLADKFIEFGEEAEK